MSSQTTDGPQPRVIKGLNYVGLKTLIKKEISRFMAVYVQTLAAPVITTLLYYTIFALAFGGLTRHVGNVPFLEFLAPGLIMMTMVQNAFANTSSSIIISKVQGTFIDLLMPPLSEIELLIGFVAGGVVRGVAVGVITWLAMVLFLPVKIHALWMVLAFGFLGVYMLSALGVIGGLWSDKFDHMSAVTNFIITPLTFLSGTFYSIESLPKMWHALALYNPFFYMIDGFRAGFIGQMDGDLSIGLISLSVVNILLTIVIYIMLRTGYKIKS
ncbi:MAG: ABC transporter permease [Alphaproteobacteria bacterium]|nr:ABC transporter permease [Alphaproteobacteria bacterium]